MIDPVLGVRLAIQSSVLDIHVLVSRIKIDIANGRRLARDGTLDADALEKGRDDEIDVLPWIGKQAHHGKGDEAAHGAAVVVAW